MGIETISAIALATSATASTYSAIDTHSNMKKQRSQYREAKAESEQEKLNQENKQKDLQNTYKNMQTNLYSGDINGINSSNLVQ